MATARAWVLNFDADDELAARLGYTTPRAVAARFDALAQRIGPLLDPQDLITDGAVRLGPHYEGRAWCPTPSAERAWARAGVRVPARPALAVLRTVNHRRFCAELGGGLPGAILADDGAGVSAAVARSAPWDRWLIKRAHGYAGRGRLVVAAGALTTASARWLAAALDRGGVVLIEPWVERDGDFGLHGFLHADGRVVFGRPTAQRIDAHGAWIASAPAASDALAPGERSALEDAAAQTAAALAHAGYFGPFGIDAFRWRESPGGALRFHPRCDVNARYSMGWATGMGAVRPDLVVAAD